jgi:microcin C transport system substrate-binding protein
MPSTTYVNAVASVVGLAVLAVLAATPCAASPALHRFDEPVAPLAHFPYAAPDAPKGGSIRLAAIGSFDSLHGHALRGVPAHGVDLTFDTLMTAGDDPHVRHCLLCESVVVAPDRAAVDFTLRREARFHDGSPVTAEDVLWTFRTLIRHGHPAYRVHYADVAGAEIVGERTVRFAFRQPSRDLPLLLGELPVLARAWWAGRDFERPLLEPPLGSGPYRIDAFESARHITYRRDPAYWARDLPVNLGRYNFDAVRIDFYRDETAAIEAFKAGAYDVRFERLPAVWTNGYDTPAVAARMIRRAEFPEDRVSGMQGFVMNTRRPFFADRRVRAALAQALDFEWINRVLLHGAYVRTRSYFNNADLSALGTPAEGERAILEPLRGRVPDEVFNREYQPPRTVGNGEWREQRRAAARLLREAGYTIEDGVLVDRDRMPVTIEILLDDAQFERVALSYAANLRRLGIAVRLRTVDTAQHQNRIERFDFDMTVALFGQSAAPGSEQRSYWSAAEADRPGSLNLAGIRDPAVDALVEAVIAAPDLHAMVLRTRALDRVLQWGYYVVPFWHMKVDRVAWWDRFGQPAATPRSGVDVTYWWLDPARDAALRQWRGQASR